MTTAKPAQATDDVAKLVKRIDALKAKCPVPDVRAWSPELLAFRDALETAWPTIRAALTAGKAVPGEERAAALEEAAKVVELKLNRPGMTGGILADDIAAAIRALSQRPGQEPERALLEKAAQIVIEEYGPSARAGMVTTAIRNLRSE